MWTRAAALAIIAALWHPPAVHAQSHEIGFYGQYVHLKPASTGGLGGRLSLLLVSGIQIEFEGAKDFKSKAFDAQFRDPTGAIVTQKVTTDGYEFLAGPRFAIRGKIPLFVSLRGGAFHFNSNLRDLPNFQPNNTLPGVPVGFVFTGTAGVFYPSAGVEFGSTSAALRVDIGDQIMFGAGQHRNNLKIQAGPVFRF